MNKLHPNHLEQVLDFLSDDDRKKVLDALYCELHNEGYALTGNTAESDVKWFARWLCDGFNNHGYSWLPENEQRFWDNLAEQCLRGLPMIINRMAMRYQTQSKALHVLLEAEWVAEKERQHTGDGESGAQS